MRRQSGYAGAMPRLFCFLLAELCVCSKALTVFSWGMLLHYNLLLFPEDDVVAYRPWVRRDWSSSCGSIAYFCSMVNCDLVKTTKYPRGNVEDFSQRISLAIDLCCRSDARAAASAKLPPEAMASAPC